MTTFPLQVSPNGRFLQDASGAPFLVHAETGWRLCRSLAREQVALYLDDRRARGFTAIHMHAIDKEGGGPRNVSGDAPFAPGEPLTRPHEAYWSQLDFVLNAIRERGFLAVVSSAWLGYEQEGWRADLNEENAAAYGRFLGERTRRLDNMVWVHGGDSNPGDRKPAIEALARALKQAAPEHLHTVHNAAEHASAAFFDESDWLDINLAYTYKDAARQVRAEYKRAGRVRPILLGETGYEDEANTGFVWTPSLVRRQPYRAILSGAAGHAYGSKTVWNFSEGWQNALGKPALRQMAHVLTLFQRVPWWRLVPVGPPPGTDDEPVAAITDDGRLLLIHLPNARPAAVNLSALGPGALRASWFNPRDGQTTPGETFRRAPVCTFAPPAGSADDDWVLSVEAA